MYHIIGGSSPPAKAVCSVAFLRVCFLRSARWFIVALMGSADRQSALAVAAVAYPSTIDKPPFVVFCEAIGVPT
jgi:hypothetical protein